MVALVLEGAKMQWIPEEGWDNPEDAVSDDWKKLSGV
jgi:hypothetical protein